MCDISIEAKLSHNLITFFLALSYFRIFSSKSISHLSSPFSICTSDNFQVPETVITHRNRISRKAAAAIAAERNRLSTVDVLGGGARDTDYLVDSDMMVVYNERTAL